MKRIDFFYEATDHQLHTKRSWVISAFSLIQEGTDDWKSDPYPYRVVQTPIGVYYVNPKNKEELIKIEDAKPGEPLLLFSEPIFVLKGRYPNVFQDIQTTVGNVFFNLCSILPNFKDKLPFIVGEVNISKIEDWIAKHLVSNLNDTKDNQAISIDNYTGFVNSFNYLTEFNQICTQGVTLKVITPPPDVAKYRQSLYEKYKDSIDNPTTIARIDAELVEYDKQYLKGDPGEKFLISGKSRNIVRKKMFLSYGTEASLGTESTGDVVKQSLYEGWDMDKFPAMNNILRAGSFNRGAETMLGGEAVKWLFRASSNIRILDQDCGSRLGARVNVTSQQLNKIIGLNIITQSGTKMVTEENANSYLGKKLIVRSPMYCKLEKTDYCKICVGERLAKSPNSASMAVTSYGSTLMLIFMKAMHGKQLKLTKANLDVVLS